MTVSTETKDVSYAGNGATTSFAVPFYILLESHINVILRASSGAESVKSLNTDYTVANAGTNPSTASITCTTFIPAIGETLLIKRSVPLTQETDYVENDSFPAESHEKALDKLTMLIQQVNGEAGRALRIPATSAASTELPNPSANKVITVNSSATGFQYSDYVPSVAAGNWPVISSIASLRLQDKTAISNAFVSGYYAAGDGGGGHYYYDAADTTSADNGCTIIVGADGGRWKLEHNYQIWAEQAGAKGDNSNDDSAALQSVLDLGYDLLLSKNKTYKCVTGLQVKFNNQKIISDVSTIINYTGTSYGIQGVPLSNSWLSGCYFSHVIVQCSTANGSAWLWRFKFSQAVECYALLLASGQTGFIVDTDYINGTGPYYNLFNNCHVLGKVGINGSANQDGWNLKQNAASPTRGPNANVWIGGRTSQLTNAYLISGSRNTFYSPTCEGTKTAVFTINGLGGGASCNSNVIHNPYIEGYTDGTGCNVYVIGSNANYTRITHDYITSIGTGTVFTDAGTGTIYERLEGYKFPNIGIADSKTLDWYEESTSALQLSIAGSTTAGTQTYAIRTGSWTRIGNRVFGQASLLLSAKDAATAGALRITGLPYAAKNTANNYGACGIASAKFDLDVGYTQVGLRIEPGQTYATLIESGDNVATATMVAANLVAASEIIFSFQYEA